MTEQWETRPDSQTAGSSGKHETRCNPYILPRRNKNAAASFMAPETTQACPKIVCYVSQVHWVSICFGSLLAWTDISCSTQAKFHPLSFVAWLLPLFFLLVLRYCNLPSFSEVPGLRDLLKMAKFQQNTARANTWEQFKGRTAVINVRIRLLRAKAKREMEMRPESAMKWRIITWRANYAYTTETWK